ncbi:hypothetical protein GGX14DRAFT_408514 [Mycena pura]|uniref:Uncharacterized protein n=1 Tax=Mycena pura TaxID=153505 RepID=A0AAD6UKV2_9AGAR|nr:hypothetical protein GGX14DRAFT_408514 [Mycena pura]
MSSWSPLTMKAGSRHVTMVLSDDATRQGRRVCEDHSLLKPTKWMVMVMGTAVASQPQDFFATPTMSTSSPSAPSSIPVQKSRGIKFWRSKPTSPMPEPSQPATDWLGPSLVAAKAIAVAGEMAPFPYLKGVFGTAVLVLETIQVHS